MSPPKVLIFDLESAPKLAYVWKFFKENISPKQVVEHGHVMSFAAKWLGEPEVFYEESRTENDKLLIEKVCYYFDQSDFVVAHFGKKFDIPQIMGRALVHGIKPPSPFRVIDTCLIARKEFNFPSNSLAYLSDALSLQTKKGDHKKFPGFQLWLECLRGNEEAWAENKEYNTLDILALEELYLRLRPYSSTHPNLAVYVEPASPTCPKCYSVDIQWRGYAHTNVGKYHRFQCNSCGGWGQSRYSELKRNANLLKNGV